MKVKWCNFWGRNLKFFVLTLLFGASIVCLMIYIKSDFYIINETFSTLLSQFSLAMIASYVFYLIQIHIPEVHNRDIAYKSLIEDVKKILENYYDLKLVIEEAFYIENDYTVRIKNEVIIALRGGTNDNGAWCIRIDYMEYFIKIKSEQLINNCNNFTNSFRFQHLDNYLKNAVFDMSRDINNYCNDIKKYSALNKSDIGIIGSIPQIKNEIGIKSIIKAFEVNEDDISGITILESDKAELINEKGLLSANKQDLFFEKFNLVSFK